jgi:hypothetical protein
MKRPAKPALPIANLGEATFKCVFPVCGGICCKNGRPPVTPPEQERIAANVGRFLPHLRPEARALVARGGWLTRRTKQGHRMLAVTGGWCVFHNEGCVLHKVGATEGDKFRYKPWHCVAFPISKDTDGSWHVRQHGYRSEAWDLFCLNPDEDPTPAEKSLRNEAAFVNELDGGKEGWRKA